MGSHEPINYLDSLQTEQATSFLHLIKVDEGALAVFVVVGSVTVISFINFLCITHFLSFLFSHS